MKILSILIEHVSFSLDRPFTYVYKGKEYIDKGFRVVVTFNHQDLIGYVLDISDSEKSQEEISKDFGFEVYEIKDILDSSPLLNDELLSLADKVSSYYIAPKISVLQAMLPTSLTIKKSTLKAPKIAYDYYVKVINDNEYNLTDKQVELLRYIKNEKEVLKRDIKQKSVLNKLLSLNLIKVFAKEKSRFEITNVPFAREVSLTKEQQNVINEFLLSKDLIYLLYGVTGSGKSEVYLAISKAIIKEKKKVLVLVPEISLTPLMTSYYFQHFKGEIAILHSQLTLAQKYDEYRKIASKNVNIVIGTRSAIFAPLDNIGLIILDEEHSESYKQDNLPFYNAHEVAFMRAKYFNAKVLLGSATPSLESFARAQKGTYHLLTLKGRINQLPLPKTEIVNLRDYKNIDKRSSIFSLLLRQKIQERLIKKEQVILLINRRGFASSYTCRNCGHVFKCPNCSIPLTYHKSDNLLKCHHCDYVEKPKDICPKCGSKYFMKIGYGTEKVEEEIHNLFPEAKTIRLDSDTTKSKNKIPLLIDDFRERKADILIGTQMVAKGHDFDNVTLVGIVYSDVGLTLPSFKSAERTFELITQAVGRAGRKDKVGEAIIQTYYPDNYAITFAAKQDYDSFFKKEIEIRKVTSYPPFTFLASIIISGKNEETLNTISYSIADTLKNRFLDNGIVIGPSSPYIANVNNTFLRHIYVKYRLQSLAHDILNDLVKSFINKNQICISINIDPFDI